MAADGMVSMKRPAGKAKDMAVPHEMHEPEYGWGLNIRLENFELDKLKMKLPRVGTKMRLEADVEVVSVNESVSKGNEGDRGVQLQITALKFEDE